MFARLVILPIAYALTAAQLAAWLAPVLALFS
jgi:hypothetical protein